MSTMFSSLVSMAALWVKVEISSTLTFTTSSIGKGNLPVRSGLGHLGVGAETQDHAALGGLDDVDARRQPDDERGFRR